jgi:hypothetical protein
LDADKMNLAKRRESASRFIESMRQGR